MTMPRILIVEDERIFALDLEARLEANGFPVVGTTATADGAVALASSRRPDVILMDICDPIEAGPGYKLYTREFYEGLKHKLNPGGIFVTQSGPQTCPHREV